MSAIRSLMEYYLLSFLWEASFRIETDAWSDQGPNRWAVSDALVQYEVSQGMVIDAHDW